MMGYSATDFAIDPKIHTITPLDDTLVTTIGQRTELSFYDGKIINLVYCNACSSNQQAADCQNGGYPDPEDCTTCICTDLYGGTLCADVKSGSSDCNPLSGEVPAPTSTDPVCITSPNYSVDQLGPQYSYDMGDSCTWMINVPTGCSVKMWITKDKYGPRLIEVGSACGHWVEIRKGGPSQEFGERLCGLNAKDNFKYFEDSPLVVSGVTSIPVTFRAPDMVADTYNNNYYARFGFRLCYAIADGSCLPTTTTTTTTTPTTTTASTTPTTTTASTTPTTTTASTTSASTQSTASTTSTSGQSTSSTSTTTTTTTTRPTSSCQVGKSPKETERQQTVSVEVEVGTLAYSEAYADEDSFKYRSLITDLKDQVPTALCNKFGSRYNGIGDISFRRSANGAVVAVFPVTFLLFSSAADISTADVANAVLDSSNVGYRNLHDADVKSQDDEEGGTGITLPFHAGYLAAIIAGGIGVLVGFGLLAYYCCSTANPIGPMREEIMYIDRDVRKKGGRSYPEYPDDRRYAEYPDDRRYAEYPDDRRYPEYPDDRRYPEYPNYSSVYDAPYMRPRVANPYYASFY